MVEKLNSGDTFPALTLALADGGSFAIPQDIESRYLIAAFYRGHW